MFLYLYLGLKLQECNVVKECYSINAKQSKSTRIQQNIQFSQFDNFCANHVAHHVNATRAGGSITHNYTVQNKSLHLFVYHKINLSQKEVYRDTFASL